MLANEYPETGSGWTVTTTEGQEAFVPAPLPPAINYSPALVRALSDADAALGELSGAGRVLPQPELLTAPFLLREAVLSCQIEGAQVSLRDVFASELGLGKAAPGVVRRVHNGVAALQVGLERLSGISLSQQLVCELHATLMDGAPPERAEPGLLRNRMVWVGAPGATAQTASYVPPPPPEMRQAIADWEAYLGRQSPLPDLLQCALIHEHFQAIHPFVMGNGLVARLLIPLYLVERGRLSQPLLCLSEFFSRNRLEYRDALAHIRRHGNWEHWFMYFLNGVRWSARRAVRQVQQLVAAREELRTGLGRLPKAQPLADILLANPYVNPAGLKTLLGVSDPTARSIIGKLEDLGILREVTGRGWGRLWMAERLMQVIDEPGEDPAD